MVVSEKILLPIREIDPNLQTIFGHSFLRELAEIARLDHDYFRNSRRYELELNRYGGQLLLLQETIPQSWQAADKILTGLLPDGLKDKVNRFSNVDHGL
ncbi:MAG: hypothetical protein U0946_03510 [Patescibacteria group bacterium]|nr:hypothetical protein [Patescibacteria group bacterium]